MPRSWRGGGGWKDDKEEHTDWLLWLGGGGGWWWWPTKGKAGRPSTSGVKMYALAQYNFFTTQVKMAGAPHYRILCHCW